ncbi:hypothetical protein [Actinomadura verrucosospora]|uniref:hypothetical protein n=1 Tax=Actinomadura verrucosospora TaxID=46165 RepID=UPI001C20BBB8|nr:hypothetical protein [Actinomadura verrucosospora]
MFRAARRRGLLPALALFLLAPLVGEFLLGNQPITQLTGLVMLAPLYGGGALLVREAARRTGRGWPTMIVLAVAYALIEEGPVDQMLWNPHYGGFDMGAAYASTHIPLLGTSVEMIEDVVLMHTIWSICVPIALVEAFTRDPRRPWLGRVGLPSVGVLFVAAAVLLGVAQAQSEHFVASPYQFAVAGAAIAGLITVGFLLGGRPAPGSDADAPSPWTVGAAAFAVTSLYWLRDQLPEGLSTWWPVAAWLVVAGGAATLCMRWSRRRGWGASQRLALAGGALLTYVWVGFTHAREMGVSIPVALTGNVVFGTAAVLLLLAAAARQPPHATPPEHHRAHAVLRNRR